MRARITATFFLVTTISITTSVRTAWARDIRGARAAQGRKVSGPVAMLAATEQNRPVVAQATGEVKPIDWAKPTPEMTAAAKKLGVPVAFENSLGIRFVLIPPGEFMMGSGDPAIDVAAKCNMPNAGAGWFWDEHPRHKVTLTKAFYISIHEVTKGAYLTLYPPPKPRPKKGEKKTEEKPAPDPLKAPDAKEPAVGVSCSNAEKFCKDLSGRDKRAYSLPTEAQWEYACRAGTKTAFAFGETVSTKQANYHGGYTYEKGAKGENREKVVPVGSLAANAWGLYDMHGNVSEWVADRYSKYTSEAQTDPKGPEKGNEHILRGGSWRSYPGACRSSFRLMRSGGSASSDVGFRACCALPTKPSEADAAKKKKK